MNSHSNASWGHTFRLLHQLPFYTMAVLRCAVHTAHQESGTAHDKYSPHIFLNDISHKKCHCTDRIQTSKSDLYVPMPKKVNTRVEGVHKDTFFRNLLILYQDLIFGCSASESWDYLTRTRKTIQPHPQDLFLFFLWDIMKVLTNITNTPKHGSSVTVVWRRTANDEMRKTKGEKRRRGCELRMFQTPLLELRWEFQKSLSTPLYFGSEVPKTRPKSTATAQRTYMYIK